MKENDPSGDSTLTPPASVAAKRTVQWLAAFRNTPCLCSSGTIEESTSLHSSPSQKCSGVAESSSSVVPSGFRNTFRPAARRPRSSTAPGRTGPRARSKSENNPGTNVELTGFTPAANGNGASTDPPPPPADADCDGDWDAVTVGPGEGAVTARHNPATTRAAPEDSERRTPGTPTGADAAAASAKPPRPTANAATTTTHSRRLQRPAARPVPDITTSNPLPGPVRGRPRTRRVRAGPAPP